MGRRGFLEAVVSGVAALVGLKLRRLPPVDPARTYFLSTKGLYSYPAKPVEPDYATVREIWADGRRVWRGVRLYGDVYRELP